MSDHPGPGWHTYRHKRNGRGEIVRTEYVRDESPEAHADAIRGVVQIITMAERRPKQPPDTLGLSPYKRNQ